MKKMITIAALLVCCLSFSAYAQAVKTDEAKPAPSMPTQARYALLRNADHSPVYTAYSEEVNYGFENSYKMHFYHFHSTNAVAPGIFIIEKTFSPGLYKLNQTRGIGIF